MPCANSPTIALHGAAASFLNGAVYVGNYSLHRHLFKNPRLLSRAFDYSEQSENDEFPFGATIASVLGDLQMCLAVPGRVVNVMGEDPAFRTGTVDFCGIRKSVNLAFLPETSVGDFVLVHVGFAITRVDEKEAKRTLEYLTEIGALEEEGLALPSPSDLETSP